MLCRLSGLAGATVLAGDEQLRRYPASTGLSRARRGAPALSGLCLQPPVRPPSRQASRSERLTPPPLRKAPSRSASGRQALGWPLAQLLSWQAPVLASTRAKGTSCGCWTQAAEARRRRCTCCALQPQQGACAQARESAVRPDLPVVQRAQRAQLRCRGRPRGQRGPSQGAPHSARSTLAAPLTPARLTLVRMQVCIRIRPEIPREAGTGALRALCLALGVMPACLGWSCLALWRSHSTASATSASSARAVHSPEVSTPAAGVAPAALPANSHTARLSCAQPLQSLLRCTCSRRSKALTLSDPERRAQAAA